METSTIGSDAFDCTFMSYNEKEYDAYLNNKIDEFKTLFESHSKTRLDDATLNFTVYKSPAKHFRQRCRFAIQDERGACLDRCPLFYHAMWDHGGPSIIVDSFPIASIQIYNIMPYMVKHLQESEPLYDSLKAVNYLSTTSGHLIATLVYGSSIDERWVEAATTLRQLLLDSDIPSIATISIIGRSKGIKLVVGTDCVQEVMCVRDGRILSYKQVDSGFSNPNSHVNVKVLDWICGNIQRINEERASQRDGADRANCVSSSDSDSGSSISNDDSSDGSSDGRNGSGYSDSSSDNDSDQNSSGGINSCRDNSNYQSPSSSSSIDLLEMYCGNGNHTLALSSYFRRILAVELNKSLCVAAEENLRLNGVKNVTIVPCDSERFAMGILRRRSYVDPKDSSISYQFSAVLVDPPRAGLDDKTRGMVCRYDHIVYISCNPGALVRDLKEIYETHNLLQVAAFDQFAYTPHLEVGVILRKKTYSMG